MRLFTLTLISSAALGAAYPLSRPQPLTRRVAIGTAACGPQILSPLRSWAAVVEAPASPLCDEDVSVLTTAAGKQIVIVGTAHTSEESANLVRSVIQQVSPDTVMVELDRRRANSLMRKARARKSGEVMAVNPSTAPQTRGEALYQELDKMGFPAGGEFVAAIEEARALNATILLGDRDINVTMQRLQEAQVEVKRLRAEGFLPREDAIAAASALPSSLKRGGGTLTPEGVVEMTTDLRRRENAKLVAAYLKRTQPPVYDAMLGERDRIMAHALRDAPGRKVVGVVGLSHLEGIERILGEEIAARPAALACASSSS